jgi:hypothetical protein
MILTIWKISDPNIHWDYKKDEDYFYRWTLEADWIFITSKTEYKYEGHCTRHGTEYSIKHGYGIPKVKYDERTNTEFLA